MTRPGKVEEMEIKPQYKCQFTDVRQGTSFTLEIKAGGETMAELLGKAFAERSCEIGFEVKFERVIEKVYP